MPWSIKALEGQHTRLEPLREDHIEALWTVADHPDIWRYMPFDASTFAGFANYLKDQLRQHAQGQSMPFATIHAPSNTPVGATSFLAVNEAHRRVEIGATWITPAHQRSAINTEAKMLQLTDAFERLDCLRVELKTDSLNLRSQTAIARLGATEEGTFRNHMVMPDGRIRHTVWFSITREEWPEVKQGLEARLTRTV